MTTQLTSKEVALLSEIAFYQTADNHSEFDYVNTNSQKGVLSSLIKKDLVFNVHEDLEEDFFMYCLTEKGMQVCNQNDIDTSHIIIY
jgi:hypothetical protein